MGSGVDERNKAQDHAHVAGPEGGKILFTKRRGRPTMSDTVRERAECTGVEDCRASGFRAFFIAEVSIA